MRSINRALIIAGLHLGLPLDIGRMANIQKPVLPSPPPDEPRPMKARRRRYFGRTQNLICDRSSNIQKLQRSPIPLLEPDERARKRHIHPRSKRNAD